MVLLVEQVRVLANEASVISDSTNRTLNSGSGWQTLYNYGNLVLSSPSLVVFSFTVSSSYGGVRLKIGNFYVFAYQSGGSISGTYTGTAYVAAGTQAVIMEGYYGGADVTVNPFKLGYAKFIDEQGSALASYSSTINLTVASRTTAVGALKKAVFMVRCYTDGELENVGDSFGDGVNLKVDGTQVTWTLRYNCSGASSGAYYCSLTVGSAHSFVITKKGGNAVHISVYACPWILFGSDNEPVTLSFPQGSTLYVTAEPLDANPTKSVSVGKKRAVSFGSSTDYYSTSSGTNLLSYSYAFEIVSASDVALYVNGLGGCIGIIGVDAR